MSKLISCADLDWQTIDGIDIPISKQFGDVYFSKDNGLLETRHVFLNGNDLTTRLAQLQNFEYFTVGETGFGTGLNILALWQLWQQVRPHNQSHLHVISVEKFPLHKDDLIRALNVWTELQPFATQLIEQYPLPIAGCHRLVFPNERFSIDLWLGDAHDVFPCIEKTGTVRAWFLDGFAPSCNPEMWQEQVLNHIVRLSDVGTTFASFSVAGVLKRGLKAHGIEISRPRGFGHKREMLKAIWQATTNDINTTATQPRQIAIIGAGIAGLSCAWAFAQRGHQVRLYDEFGAACAASGNPLALINPKLCPIEQSFDHLMTIAWQYALRFYAPFHAFRKLAIHQVPLKNHESLLSLANQYPENILEATQSNPISSLPTLKLQQAGAVNPKALAQEILQHPKIEYIQAKITNIDNTLLNADHLIVCCALNSADFFEQYPTLKAIRGQVSWLNNADCALSLDHAYSYGGYCMQLDEQHLILGASFQPNFTNTDVTQADHVHNLELLQQIAPEYAAQLTTVDRWQGRAALRAQSADYFPLVGKMDDREVYTLAGLGSKGFLFAPLCAEILAAQILKESCPVPSRLMQKLDVKRFKKKQKIKKPYFQK